ncbi:hypothetical protein F5141DRAFT_56945 [Pisolithus sp. B1]|nr:hypothetical protein F5141DRAFT_56945 [Pisolithus sp. B1]
MHDMAIHMGTVLFPSAKGDLRRRSFGERSVSRGQPVGRMNFTRTSEFECTARVAVPEVVSVLALGIVFVSPITSSRRTREPRLLSADVGTDTTLIAALNSLTRRVQTGPCDGSCDTVLADGLSLGLLFVDEHRMCYHSNKVYFSAIMKSISFQRRSRHTCHIQVGHEKDRCARDFRLPAARALLMYKMGE